MIVTCGFNSFLRHDREGLAQFFNSWCPLISKWFQDCDLFCNYRIVRSAAFKLVKGDHEWPATLQGITQNGHGHGDCLTTAFDTKTGRCADFGFHGGKTGRKLAHFRCDTGQFRFDARQFFDRGGTGFDFRNSPGDRII